MINKNSRPVIEIRDLHKYLPLGGQQLHILKNINLTIHDKEMVAIVGPSGSGKSTLMGLMGGLDSVSSGNITIDESINITQLSERELTNLRNQKIGFVFQYFNLIPTLTALENVMLPMQFSRQRGAAQKRAKRLLDMFHLGDRMNHGVRRLSGGEQQRVAIARALINKPSLLLCDEPTGNLDTASTGVVIDALFNVRDETGTTVIVVTHDPLLAEQMDRQIELVDGEIIRTSEQPLAINNPYTPA